MCLEAEIARAEIVAGLVGLASAPDHCPVLTLQYIGTAVRMGLESPRQLFRWVDTVSLLVLESAIDETLDALEHTSMFSGVPWSSDEEYVEIAVKDRDYAECVRLGLARACIARRVFMRELKGWDPFTRRLDEMTASLRHVGRTRALAFLGSRRYTLGGGGGNWLNELPA